MSIQQIGPVLGELCRRKAARIRPGDTEPGWFLPFAHFPVGPV